MNPTSQEVAFTYDPMGRLRSKVVGAESTEYVHDAMGRLVRAVGPGCDLRLERDLAGRVVAEWVNGRSTVSTYDSTGRRVERVTPSGARALYGYDAVGRMIGLSTSGHAIEFGHDAAGQEISRRIDASLRLDQTWDASGRPVEERWTTADRLVQGREYSYGVHHGPSRVSDVIDGPVVLHTDAMGRVRGLEAEGRWESYDYDVAGHITSASWSGYPACGVSRTCLGSCDPSPTHRRKERQDSGHTTRFWISRSGCLDGVTVRPRCPGLISATPGVSSPAARLASPAPRMAD
ncbi:hypothetical protein SVIOM342S_00078 [Streptomyces violaceorubidus]